MLAIYCTLTQSTISRQSISNYKVSMWKETGNMEIADNRLLQPLRDDV